MESLWSSLKYELVSQQRFATRAETRTAIFDGSATWSSNPPTATGIRWGIGPATVPNGNKDVATFDAWFHPHRRAQQVARELHRGDGNDLTLTVQ